jgi:arylsulfatase
MDRARMGEAAGRELPGKDFSSVLGSPARARINDVRDSVLYTFSGLAQTDSELMRVMAEATSAGQDVKAAMKQRGFKPDLRKRGSLRMAFDGRYKFTRYFSPLERHRPATLDELYRRNDVELFDLAADPGEMTNLAHARGANADLVARMNAKLDAAIAAEMGADDGREMPEVAGIDWSAHRVEL